MQLEKYVAMAKSAKDFASSELVNTHPNTAKAHIDGLADMVLRLVIEVKSLSDALEAAEGDV